MLEENESYEINQRAEFQRVCHILHSEEERMEFLKKLKAEELFFLRGKIADAIQNQHSETWEKLAAVTKFMPNFINAKIAEDVLGPSISANLTYYVPVKEAINISTHFSIKFMCDIIEYLNPARLETLLAEYPVDKIKKIVFELDNRRAYYTMGNFVDYIPQNKVTLIAGQIQSEETLIRSASFANKKHRLGPVIREFTDSRIKSLLLKGHELNLRREIIDIIPFLPPLDLNRYIGILFTIGGEVFKKYLEEVKSTGGDALVKVKESVQSLGLKVEL